MAKSKETIEEIVVQEVPKEEKNPTEEFIARKLRAINMMENKAKARKLAERVLANRKGIR